MCRTSEDDLTDALSTRYTPWFWKFSRTLPLKSRTDKLQPVRVKSQENNKWNRGCEVKTEDSWVYSESMENISPKRTGH